MGAFAGRHAIVTGAGSGSGEAIALALANEGATVTAIGRRPAPLEALAAKGAGIYPAVADVTDRAGLGAAIAAAAARHGAPSLVVANAGSAESEAFTRTSEALFRKIIDVNLTGVFNTFQASLESMDMKAAGQLVAIASTASLKGYPYVSAYVAAKHGVLGLVRSLALELARSRLTVNAICPGFMDTPMLDRSIATIAEKTGRSLDEARASLTKINPQGRFIAPAEVAGTVLWLASDAAASVTGQAVALSGGET
jgi:NAD(P)-dependent dehydrogenase (short-subunit alcohol dehydrogenase family)